MNNISSRQLKEIKYNETNAMKIITNFCENRHLELDGAKTGFCRFLIKQSLYLSFIINNEKNTDSMKTMNLLISDFLDLIEYTILGYERPFSLIERSIIENYIRLTQKTYLNDNHITATVIEAFHNDYKVVITEEEYSLVKTVYADTSKSIHGDINSDILQYIDQHFHEEGYFSKTERDFQRMTKVIRTLNYCFAIKFKSEMYNTFYRRTTLLEYLTSTKIKDKFLELGKEL